MKRLVYEGLRRWAPWVPFKEEEDDTHKIEQGKNIKQLTKHKIE